MKLYHKKKVYKVFIFALKCTKYTNNRDPAELNYNMNYNLSLLNTSKLNLKSAQSMYTRTSS